MSNSATSAFESDAWDADASELTVVDDPDAVATLLSLLDDEDCRAVLRVADDRPWSARELATACDVPPSTMYRKLDRLATAGLLDECIDICRSGRHTRGYRRAISDVSVSVDGDGFGVTLTPRDVAELGPRFRLTGDW